MHNYLLKTLIFSAIAITLFPMKSFGREVKYKDFVLELHDGDRLVIVGAKGSVKLTPNSKALVKGASESISPAEGSPGNGGVRVKKTSGNSAADAFDSWTFSVRREGSHVRVEAKGPDGKTEWEEQIKNGPPEMHFEIDAPAVPVEIAMREGFVQVAQWKSSVQVQLVEGQARFQKNEGSLKVQVGKGEIKVEQQKGRTEIDGFNPKVVVAQIDGELTLDNFAGEANVQGVKGNVQVTTFSGQTVASKVDGNVDFQVGRGTLNLQDLSGSLRGKLDNGSLIARISGEPEVNIESQEGGVSLDIGNGASPNVRLQSEEGSLVAPGDLAQAKTGALKTLSGRLNGGGNGSIFVKTKTGNVRVF